MQYFRDGLSVLIEYQPQSSGEAENTDQERQQLRRRSNVTVLCERSQQVILVQSHLDLVCAEDDPSNVENALDVVYDLQPVVENV